MNNVEITTLQLPEAISEFSICYDGGRFSVSINGQTYTNNGVGNDFELALRNENVELTVNEW